MQPVATANGTRNIGICAIEIYFPSTCVWQSELEKHDGVSTGKYTIGLEQKSMAVCSDNEDINSICLTGERPRGGNFQSMSAVVSSLFSKYGICPSMVGRLEVGTETNHDKSKSVKTCLMQLFNDNTSVVGVDCLNACFGGTAALMNAVAWIESEDWDGRLALVVAGDIAVYEKGPARPTGGAGAVAMVVGPDAPIVVERGVAGCHMEHVYDFCKPNPFSQYPVVDGHLSIASYMRALDICYARYVARVSQRAMTSVRPAYFDYFAFHAPFSKLIRKAHARIVFNDYLMHPHDDRYASICTPDLADHRVMDLCRGEFEAKTAPSLLTAQLLGNLYCGSLYAGLVSLIHAVPSLTGKRIGMFSYGSGAASMFFSVLVVGPTDSMRLALNLAERLSQRISVDPETFEQQVHHHPPRRCLSPLKMRAREAIHGARNVVPSAGTDLLFPGTFYVAYIDANYQRVYERKF